jgi:glycosyltransferase involved in cell wall biosynthesis
MPPELSLVIPCYNEATHLRASAAALLRCLDRSRLDYEVVFVDDCSRDATREILAEVCASSARCRAIHHERNRGRGAAFKTGFAAATGRVTGFIDIDLEIHPLYIPQLVSLIEDEGYDVATGHRYYLLSQTHALHRHVLSKAYRWLCRLALGFGVRDSETGCKFFRRETATGVVLGSANDGWFWDTEVMARAALENLRIAEMPVLFLRQPDKPSSVRIFRDTWRYLVDLHRFRIEMGLSLSSKSPIYWTGVGYDLAMRALYGRELEHTYAEVARRIPDGASVVDVCAGTCRLYRDFLRQRGCEYTGLEFNGHFVMSARRRGVPVRRFDVLHEEVPAADYAVMCSSLYHFHEREQEILEKLRRAARKAVIVSEPIANLSARGPSAWGRLLRRLTDPGVGDYSHRYDLAGFRALAERHGASEFVHEPDWRNALAVFAGRG